MDYQKNNNVVKNIYWIGPRLSDIMGIEHIFKGAIVLFGNNSINENFYCNPLCSSIKKRIDHNNNKYNEIIGCYLKKEIKNILRHDKHAYFLWYNVTPNSLYDNTIMERSLCFNNQSLINLLTDKLRCRLLMSNHISVLPSSLVLGIDCQLEKFQKRYPGYDQFILQEPNNTSGGFGTHIFPNSHIGKSLNSNQDYLLSPYYKDSVSINQHIVVYEKDVMLFPPSVQLIKSIDDKLQYCGGDFSAISDLDSQMLKQINNASKKIGEILSLLQYRGIAGIDYIVYLDKLYFIELNTRFQGSSIALNKILSDNGFLSLQEYHLSAFKETYKRDEIIIKYPINLSVVSYHNDNEGHNLLLRQRIVKRNNCNPNIIVVDDGLNDEQDYVENGFLYRILVHSNVCSIINNKTHLHPNILPDHLSLKYSPNRKDFSKLKIALLVHGVNIDSRIDTGLSNLKRAVGNAFDIIIDNKYYINTYVKTKYAELSPFFLQWTNHNFFKLFYNNNYIVDVKVDTDDPMADNTTNNRIRYYTIAQFFTDRLRIHPFPYCVFAQNGKPCKFCDLGNRKGPYTVYTQEDIFEVIYSYIHSYLPIEHFLIGGGSSTNTDAWNKIGTIAKYIRKYTNKGIYLMSIPPASRSTLKYLYTCGVTEVGFNIELYNRQLAQRYMPGKGNIKLEHYANMLSYATELWGTSGNVRSLLMVGLEPIEDTLKGVEFLCKSGVLPILSLFRPLPNTPLEHITPMDYTTVYSLWEKANNICRRYNLILGPYCIPCQNNTISVPSIFV